jgi:hypothetical protein
MDGFSSGRSRAPNDDEEVELSLKSPAADVLRLQRSLPDAVPGIVARGQKQDGAPPTRHCVAFGGRGRSATFTTTQY